MLTAVKIISCFSMKENRLPVVLFFVLVGLMSSRLIDDKDIGFHMHAGQWILENERFFDMDTFTYTVNDHPYIDLHWLYQIVVYGIYSMLGFEWVSLVYALLVILLFSLILVWSGSKRVASGLAVWILLFSLLIAETRFNHRPEIASWIFMIIVSMVLDYYLSSRKRILWLLPVIIAVWVNTHGLFILGVFIIVTYAISDFFSAKRIDRYLWIWGLGGIIAVLINPYFLKGALFPLELLTRFDSANVFKNDILEFASPWSSAVLSNPFIYPRHVVAAYFVWTALIFILMAVTIRQRKLYECIVTGALFAISAVQFRNIPLFVLYSSVILAVMLQEVWVMFKAKRNRPARSYNFIGLLYVAIIIMLSARVSTNAYYISDRRPIRIGWGIDMTYFAEGAAQFIKDNRIEGRILNSLGIGGWLAWKTGEPVFIDGRLEVMQEALYKEVLSSYKKGGLIQLIEQHNHKLIVADYTFTGAWLEQLKDLHDWRLVYWDATTVIYVVKGLADHVPSIEMNAVLENMGLDTSVTRPADVTSLIKTSQDPLVNWFSGFITKIHYPIDILNKARFAESQQQYRIAEKLYVEFIKRTRGCPWEAFYNLGMVFVHQSKWTQAALCLDYCVSMKPDDRSLQRKLREIESRM